VHVEGQLVFNGTFQMLNAALTGFGLANVPEDVAQPHLAEGRLEDWSLPIRAITSTTRAAANPRRPSPCWSRRCATVGLRQLRLKRTQRAGRGPLNPQPDIQRAAGERSHSTGLNLTSTYGPLINTDHNGFVDDRRRHRIRINELSCGPKWDF
jgi:hypothetical protein